MKKHTVAILGCGSRGCYAYGDLFVRTGKFDIVSLCDLLKEKTDEWGDKYGVKEEMRFNTEEEFFKEKRADLLVVATLDKDHVRQAVKGLELGYDLLLEKPISDSEEECKQLLAAQKKYGGRVLVCHVLRYSVPFVKLKELLDEGRIGRLVMIDAIEQVTFWHQAHSYVRGNWRRAEDTTPMILAKCCHDLDLLQYYAGSRCESVSSVGDLTYFTKQNQPEGAADRCSDCKFKESCPYSAYNIYFERTCWPTNVLTAPYEPTKENVTKAIEEGPYGRCVFACDNDVVDHQIVTATFENGVKANLKMTAFTRDSGRIIKFHGTTGEIYFDESKIVIKPYVKMFKNTNEEVIDCNKLVNPDDFGHAGGDGKIVEALIRMLDGEENPETSLEKSIESHLMGIAAEKSRLNGGELVKIR